ncbi:MAG: hypothetical protein BGO39_23910 [Chloroflexi bacterium 54-19]|nr:MAG: hypothetical protein BGO39_23910 [Chloroflexi bacterium 54-19]
MKKPLTLNLFAADAAFPDQPWKNGSAGIESSEKKVSKALLTCRCHSEKESHLPARAMDIELTKRRLGTGRIQNELKREYDCSLSRGTIHKVLTNNNVKPLVTTRRIRKIFNRYERVIPGERL